MGEEKAPKVAVFQCSGCMSSVGTLTTTASLEAFKRLNNEEVGLFCLSAIANEVPKHRKTTEKAETIIAVDGCGFNCTTNVLRAHGFEPHKQLNLVKDLHLKKIGPFKPFDYSREEFEMVVKKIVEICEESLTKEEKED